ncbi:MAG TPA: DNA-formamidopyrimidine glycosylase [Candidatus Omnitrophica bacterium]|nr:DNA-formamidopyrimidine glycosylase [Candidatus Omnitrophota bacterium]
MPELPEVETIKRELNKDIIGKKIVDVVIKNPKVIKQITPAKFSSQIKNSSIKQIIRKGKILIFGLSTGKFLVIHLRMTGQLVFPGNKEKSRVSFVFSNKKILDFNDSRLLGELKLMDDWRNLKFIKELGPEPFEINETVFGKMLGAKKTKIKPLLLDQKFIAGIGNLYAAEVLFRSRVYPERPASSLSSKEKKLLFKEIKDTLREAIKCGGSSIDQYVRLSGKRGNYAAHHKVYNRKDKPCFVCKTPVKRMVQGGRGTYFCPKCQK